MTPERDRIESTMNVSRMNESLKDLTSESKDGEVLDLADLFSKLRVSDSPTDNSSDNPSKRNADSKKNNSNNNPSRKNANSPENDSTNNPSKKNADNTTNGCTDHPKEKELDYLSLAMGDMKVEKIIHAEVKETSIKYYAVALPAGLENPGEGSLIYTELKDALKAIKMFKGARFREFANKNDALLYAAESLENIQKKSIVDGEDNLRHRSSQELCHVRKTIERGEETYFVGQVWLYPRTLVTEADIPTVMQHGMRFNALHVAANSNKPLICQLILDILENPHFSELLYPTESPSMRSQRMYQVRDLYLNTGTKKMGDTPLHYASKFGYIDCCKVLMSHPQCDSEKKNVDGLTAREIVCSRLNPVPSGLKDEMTALFNEGMLYVPVLRSNNDISPPIVGKPCYSQDIDRCASYLSTIGDPKLSLKAFAGPMSSKMAQQFYKALKNPSSPKNSPLTPEEKLVVSKIKFTDPEKGIERIGRHLADDLKVDWQEYFPTLNVFANFSTKEGLNILENHLKRLQESGSLSLFSDSLEPAEQSIALVHQYPPHVNPLGHRVNVYYSTLDQNRKVEVYGTPPSSPEYITPPTSPSGSPLSCVEEKAVFLEGSTFSKLDADVLLAVQDYDINPKEYPNVCKWKLLVTAEMQIQSAMSRQLSLQRDLTPLKSRICGRERPMSRKTLF